MFFIISGFIITWLMLIEEAHCGRVSVWRFYARRALRILPVYLVFLVLTCNDTRYMADRVDVTNCFSHYVR